MRRLGRWLTLAVAATAVIVVPATPAMADASECSVPYARADVVELRADKPIDLRFDCDLWEQGGPGELQLSVTAAPGHGTVGQPQWNPELGSHTVRYDPADAYLGSDTFTITATDDDGTFEHVVALRMSPNRAPSCHPEGWPEGTFTFDHTRVGESKELSVLCVDLDEQDIWEIDTDVRQAPAHGEVSLTLVRNDYERHLVVTYTPDPGFTGSDSFEAGVFDGELKDHVTFYVNVADGPWCMPWQQETIRAGKTGTFGPFCSQPNGVTPQLRVVDQPSQGVAEPQGTAIRYRPDADASGHDSFTYQAYSSSGEGNVVTQEWDVLPNAAPVCDDRSAATPMGSSVAVTLTCTDPDGDDHDLAITDPPAHGTLGELTDGAVTYTPDPGWDGTDSFTYVAADFARTSAPATVTVAVTEDEAPLVDVAVPDQTPARVASRGMRLRLTTNEPVTADVALVISPRLARRLDVPRRIGSVSDAKVGDTRRVTVDLTRKASRALETRQKLPLVVDVVASDEWGNSLAVELSALLR